MTVGPSNLERIKANWNKPKYNRYIKMIEKHLATLGWIPKDYFNQFVGLTVNPSCGYSYLRIFLPNKQQREALAENLDGYPARVWFYGRDFDQQWLIYKIKNQKGFQLLIGERITPPRMFPSPKEVTLQEHYGLTDKQYALRQYLQGENWSGKLLETTKFDTLSISALKKVLQTLI